VCWQTGGCRISCGKEQGRLKQRQRRRIMSYPLVIRLMLVSGG